MNILLIRTSAMGDIVHCLPVLRTLRRQLPEARIGWVVEHVFSPLLEDRSDLDTKIPVRLKKWRKKPWSRAVRTEFGTALRAMRSFAPDVTIDLMGNHKGGILAALSGAQRTIGPARQFRREPSSAVWINEPVPTPQAHAVDRALALLPSLVPRATADGPVSFGADELLAHAPPEATKYLGACHPYVLIQAGAGWQNKCYPPRWWGEVARLLRQATGLDILIPIAPGEAQLAHEVVAGSKGAAVAVDAPSLPFLAALLRRTRLLLGGDTGPLHLAHALGTAVLCVMGPTDPQRNGPYRAPDRALWHQLPCSFCYKRMKEAKACLLTVTPQEITQRACALLGATTARASSLSRPTSPAMLVAPSQEAMTLEH